MRKKQTTKTVEFANLPEDHKAEFIQFLIKNNICFQEGKQNCTARVSLKPTKSPNPHPLKEQPQQPSRTKQTKQKEILHRSQQTKKIVKPESKPLQTRHDILNRQNVGEVSNRQIKTPTKEHPRELKGSSLNCGKALTSKKAEQTPRSNLSMRKSMNVHSLNKNINSSSKKLREEQISIARNSTQKLAASQEKEKEKQVQVQVRNKLKVDASRERTANKYSKLFELSDKGRPVRWPTNLLDRTIQQIYDDIFTRNTQCLQNRNISHALKTLTQVSFPQLVEGYFRKKFKGSKLAATNLHNMLHTLGSLAIREGCPVFIRTFEDFLTGQWQHQDLLYYLFARNVLKRQLRVNDKTRDLNRTEGCYFTETLKSRDVSRCLLGIIGKDPQLISEYRNILTQHLGGQQVAAYEFLRVLLEDYHAKRVGNKLGGQESLGQTLFGKDRSCDGRNNTEELTFGQDHQDQKEALMDRCSQFWTCQEYSRIRDSLFDLIMEKMAQKVVELVQLLATDIQAPTILLQSLEQILLRKAESLVKAVFQMNKMKWFKQLAITQPCEDDISVVEQVQMRFRDLRSNPSGREIGEFCKAVLTTKALVNQLELALMISQG